MFFFFYWLTSLDISSDLRQIFAVWAGAVNQNALGNYITICEQYGSTLYGRKYKLK